MKNESVDRNTKISRKEEITKTIFGRFSFFVHISTSFEYRKMKHISFYSQKPSLDFLLYYILVRKHLPDPQISFEVMTAFFNVYKNDFQETPRREKRHLVFLKIIVEIHPLDQF